MSSGRRERREETVGLYGLFTVEFFEWVGVPGLDGRPPLFPFLHLLGLSRRDLGNTNSGYGARKERQRDHSTYSFGTEDGKGRSRVGGWRGRRDVGDVLRDVSHKVK